MIRYPVTLDELRRQIDAVDENWFDAAAAVIADLPDPPRSSDFKPLWSKIKGLYIQLQNSKCCFCEKPLEGNIEQDVEHFRPKAEVKPWKVPDRLADEGVVVRQPDDGSSEAGYAHLAYMPLNYAMACKTCNSTLKKNLFPIEAKRSSEGTDPARMAGEKALFLYPIGSHDADPEDLIGFEALSPLPRAKSGFKRRRALVTIEVFRLDDSTKRRSLFKQRAYLLRLLFLELEGRDNAPTAAQRQTHEKAIEALIAPEAPFTNCLRSFERLHGTDHDRAEEIAEECLKFMSTRSARRPGT